MGFVELFLKEQQALSSKKPFFIVYFLCGAVKDNFTESANAFHTAALSLNLTNFWFRYHYPSNCGKSYLNLFDGMYVKYVYLDSFMINAEVCQHKRIHLSLTINDNTQNCTSSTIYIKCIERLGIR